MTESATVLGRIYMSDARKLLGEHPGGRAFSRLRFISSRFHVDYHLVLIDKENDGVFE